MALDQKWVVTAKKGELLKGLAKKDLASVQIKHAVIEVAEKNPSIKLNLYLVTSVIDGGKSYQEWIKERQYQELIKQSGLKIQEIKLEESETVIERQPEKQLEKK